jgi:hypothetical protein
MKPKLNRKIYCIYETCIFETKVAFIGESSFIQEQYGKAYEEESWEYNFADYGKTWFATLAQAKRKLREKYPNCKFVRGIGDTWEVEENEN